MHTIAWVAWVMLVMVVALTTTNPYHLGIVLLSVLLVAVLAPKTATGVTSFRALLFFGASMLIISVAISVINGNYGSHELFTIPGPALPWWLGGLRLGGPVSAEGLVAALTRGMAILSVLLAFGVFNGAVSPHRVLRTAPAAVFQAGLIVTVGLTLLPSSIEDLRRIREMQALRGGRGGLGQLPALVVPAVIGGLERSMRLAEAMEARGYGAAPASPRLPRLAGQLSAPLLLAAAGGWFYYEPLRVPAAITGALGVVAFGWWMTSAAHTRHTTALTAEPFSLLDRALAVASFVLAAATLGLALAGWDGLKYNPFAGLPWPRLEPGVALLPLSIAWPALRLLFSPHPATTPLRLSPPAFEP
ncbi:MAG: energy-coupling factor transporter transmembrane component T [Tepidiformaceae bacterium]